MTRAAIAEVSKPQLLDAEVALAAQVFEAITQLIIIEPADLDPFRHEPPGMARGSGPAMRGQVLSNTRGMRTDDLRTVWCLLNQP
jgi:hypothetical protein